MTAVTLPPLFQGVAITGDDVFAAACERARAGCDAGLVLHEERADALHAAIVFAPEVPLREALVMLPVCAVGLQNAFGAIAPPEVAMHIGWGGDVRVNGACAGQLRVAAASCPTDDIPDWLVIGLTLGFWPANDDTGHTPDVTALHAEGCGDVTVPDLLEAWVRHTLVWIDRWSDEGPRRIHREWTQVAHGLDTTVTRRAQKGVFKGVDEDFGMILQAEDATRIIPLSDILTEVS